MPTYEFQCQKCGHRFNFVESIAEHDKQKEKCPRVPVLRPKALISAVAVKTAKKS